MEFIILLKSSRRFWILQQSLSVSMKVLSSLRELTEVLERLLDLLVGESQDDLRRQQGGVQPVLTVISKHTVCSESVVGLTF